MEDYDVMTENHDMIALCKNYCDQVDACAAYKAMACGKGLDERVNCPLLETGMENLGKLSI